MADVSIVIPCFNGHAFVAEAVASARAQTLREKEVIVIDDGSTAPETARALNALPGDVRVVRQENRGLGGARNRGFEEARGRYVLALDHDDLIEPGCAARALALIDGREDAFVFPWYVTFGDYEVVVRTGWNMFQQLFVNDVPYAALVPKALWRRAGGYDESASLDSDWEFNVRLGLAGAEAICLPEAMLRYRVLETGMRRSLDIYRQGTLWRRIQRKHPDDYSPRGLLRHWRANRGLPTRYPVWAMLGYFAAHRVLPDRAFTGLFKLARERRERNRQAASRAGRAGRRGDGQ